jgi:hypothetical protein
LSGPFIDISRSTIAVLRDWGPVHKYVSNARWRICRETICSCWEILNPSNASRSYFRGIENADVGVGALTDHPPILETEDSRRLAGQFVHRLLEGKHFALPHPITE